MVMAYIVMAYVVMAYIVVAYILVAYIGATQKSTASPQPAYIVMAYTAMTYIVVAYVVMAYIGATKKEHGLTTASDPFSVGSYRHTRSWSTTSIPKITPVNSCMAVPFGTCPTKIAELRFVVGQGCNRTMGGLGFTRKNIV